MTDQPRGSATAPLRLMPRRRFVQGSVVLAGGASAGLLSAPNTLAGPDGGQRWVTWMAQNGDGTPASIDDYVPVAFSEAELESLKAAIDRLIPTDDISPGAVDAGVFIYIDRLMATSGSALLSTYQAGLAALNATQAGDFAAMTPDDQDALLAAVEAGDVADAPAGFFPLMLEHTRQGMFGDPIHGGNREFAGWDLIGYPGIKLVWTEADQTIGAEVEPEHISVEQYGGTA